MGALLERDMPLATALPLAFRGPEPVVLRQLSVGQSGSGAPWHWHQDAFNICVVGERAWFLKPPAHALMSRQPVSDGVPQASGSLFTLQRPGDIVYVPELWSHCVVNSVLSLSVALEMACILKQVAAAGSSAVQEVPRVVHVLPSQETPNAGHRRGSFQLPGGSQLKYKVCGSDDAHRVLEVEIVEVPDTPSGQEAAQRLCREALGFAREMKAVVLPTCPRMASDFVQPQLSQLEGEVLRSFDDATPGLEISLRLDGLATLRLTNNRRRNPLTKALLERMRDFLAGCAAMEVTEDRPLPAVRAILLASTGP
ncbi:unnamed protein product, partial [Polarella glacialis]